MEPGEPPPDAVPAVAVRWAGWQSLLLAGGIMLLYLFAQGLLMGLLAALEVVAGGLGGDVGGGNVGAAVSASLRDHAGLFFSLAALAAAPLVWLACLGVARAGTPFAASPSERRAAVRRFLGLTRPRWRRALPWLLATAAVLAVYETASRLLGRPPAPDFMVDFLRTTSWPGLLVAAVVIAAPLAEEAVFRGLMLPGLARGRLGAVGAVALTAALWAVVHGQYDLFDMSAVFTLGLVFGAARLHTRSLWVPLLLHAAVNALAMVQMLA